LKIDANNLPIVQLADDANLDIGTAILSVGFPGSSDDVTDATLTPTYKDGKINSKKTREDGLIPVYEVSAAMSGGMSGGPTVTLDGKVVGINSFGPAGESQQFNFISPASLIKETLQRNGVKNELSQTDVAYRAGLDAYFKGDYVTAQKKFEEVLAKDPTDSQAQDFKSKAADKVASMPATTAPSTAVNAVADQTASAANASSSSSTTPILIGVGLLVVVVVVVGLVLMMRKGGSTPAVAGAPGGAPYPGQPPMGQPPAQPMQGQQPYGQPPAQQYAAPQQPPAQQPFATPPAYGTPGVPGAPGATTEPMPPAGEPPAPMGAPYSGATQAAVPACSNCGFVPDASQRFCPSCGNDLNRA
jgi:hypothetical protein